MKKLSILLLILSYGIMTYAANDDLGKMSQEQRNEYLIKLSKKVIIIFGPGYYRENSIPIISDYKKFQASGTSPEEAKCTGREYYTVTFPYDKTKECLDFDFAARVDIWKDTGEPMEVLFGNGYGRNFFSLSFEEQTANNAIIETVPYRQVQKIKKEW